MDREDKIKAALATHPCYNEEAHHDFARMHLSVAPKCNIQCNYCNRKYAKQYKIQRTIDRYDIKKW